MPKEMEQHLRAQAEKKRLTGDRKNAYIYGTMMEKTSWRPHRKKRKKKRKS
jgi:hypothetical protein